MIPEKSFAKCFAEGVLEIRADGHRFLRWANYNYRPSPEDVFTFLHRS